MRTCWLFDDDPSVDNGGGAAVAAPFDEVGRSEEAGRKVKFLELEAAAVVPDAADADAPPLFVGPGTFRAAFTTGIVVGASVRLKKLTYSLTEMASSSRYK